MEEKQSKPELKLDVKYVKADFWWVNFPTFRYRV